MNFFIVPQFSKRWTGGNYDDYLVTPDFVREIFHTRTEVGGNLLYDQKWPQQQLVVLSPTSTSAPTPAFRSKSLS